MTPKIFSVEIDDDDLTGIDLISIVGAPAIESNFIRLAEQKPVPVVLANTEKQYVTGPVLIPDKHIYRNSDEEGEHYLVFSAANIEKIRNKFMRSGKTKLSSLEHDSERPIDAYLIESWIVSDPEKDKATALGLKDVKQGSLFATYHIPDKEVWQSEIIQRNGFSLEGLFNQVPVKASKQKSELETLLDEVLEALQTK